MLVFCAYWEGTVRENPNEFDRYVSEVHLPLEIGRASCRERV